MGRQLAEHVQVIIPDLRNHGQSPHSRVFDLPSLEADILELIESLELSQVCLMGHSLGGKIAMEISLHEPQLVGKLVVVDISPRKYPVRKEHVQLLHAMMHLDLSGLKSRVEAENQLKQWIPNIRIRQFILKNLTWNDQYHLTWRLNLPAISENLPAMFEGVSLAGEYSGPALFIRGGLSDYIQEDDLPEINKRFPASIIKTIPVATHWVHADAPGQVVHLLREFLGF